MKKALTSHSSGKFTCSAYQLHRWFPLSNTLYEQIMENILSPFETLDRTLFIVSIGIALIYFRHYIYCHAAIAFGIFGLLLSLVFAASFFDCDLSINYSIYKIFGNLRSCMPLKSNLILYLSAFTTVTALTGYIRVTAVLLYKLLKKHITSKLTWAPWATA